ncbi:hypothetical protein H2248_000710 [Termitomyces sp. 'cryptogamus']|nr:hypothetical protein H2248_000710 [Termitomyces sp. 'cryptogamus']
MKSAFPTLILSPSPAYRRLACLKPILIQESVAHDPWKLLIAVTLLNKTTGKLAIPVFKTIIAKWPTPWALSHAILKPLGTHNIRSSRLIKLSELYLRDPPYVPDLRPSTPRLPSSDTLAHDSSSKRTSPSPFNIRRVESSNAIRQRTDPVPEVEMGFCGTQRMDSWAWSYPLRFISLS